jgi:membrane-associated phospholipid phosphatase
MSLYKNILNDFFASVTLFGHPVFYIFIIIILLKFNLPFALHLLPALLFVEALCIIIKLVYRKERPILQSRKGFYNLIDANSFPSVHSARISLLATAIIFYYQNILFTFLGVFLALLVGYSRIHLKRHYFFDVVFGFLLGIITAFITFKIY